MPPYRPQGSAALACNALVGNRDGAAFRLLEPQQQADGRGFPGAGFADKRVCRACRNRKRNIIHSGQGFAIDGEALGNAADSDLWRFVTIEKAEPRIAKFGITLRVERGHVAMEFFGIGRGGGGKNSRCPARFLHDAVLQHDEIVRPLRRYCEIMGDEKQADVQLIAKTGEEIENAFLDCDVERRSRLIRHQQCGAR